MRFRPAQLKAISEFLNTVAAAWFSAGVISPLFVQIEWTIDNVYYFAAIVSSLFLIGLYFLVLRNLSKK